jgi:hypothetical protein
MSLSQRTKADQATDEAEEGFVHERDALAHLDAAIQQLKTSRRRLEAEEALSRGGNDALLYIATAEMQLKAAHFRLEEETNGHFSSPAMDR